MLCYHGQLRSGSLITRFHSDRSTATTSATNNYETIPERPSRNTKDVPSSYLVLPQNLFNELICILPVLEQETLSYLVHIFFYLS